MKWFNYEEEDKKRIDRSGEYNGQVCPNCKRLRMMLCNDGKRRCEKCAWCIEDEEYHNEGITL